MKAKLMLFSMLLGIPLVAFLVASGIQYKFSSDLKAAIMKELPDADPEKVAKLSIDNLCQNPDPSFTKLCETNSNLNLMRNGAIGSGIAGLALIITIHLAGLIARDNRRLLLWLFKPGLYLTACILAALTVVYGLLAMSATYYGETVFIGRVHFLLIGGIGFGGFAGAVALLGSVFSTIKTAKTTVIGTAILRAEAPVLWALVDSLADTLDSLKPENIVIGLDPNFFVTEADVLCMSGTLSGRTLYCSLPLMRILTGAEFLSIAGHELGHFKGLDTKYSTHFYPVYRGTASAISALDETGETGYGAVALLPAVAILGYFFECFSVAESRISRAREFAADRAGASVTNAADFSSALVKVHAYSRIWSELQEDAVKKLQEGRMFINASATFASVVSDIAGPSLFEGIAESRVTHPTDSHPPLAVRLEALQTSINGVSDDALNVNPAEPAIFWVDSYERMEEELSSAYQVVLAQRLGIDLERVGQEMGQATA